MPKRILIINTGGTLSSVKSSKGLVPGMSSGDMLEELRMVSKNLELETEDFCSLDSPISDRKTGPDLQHSSQEEVMIIMGLW
mgnify:CR=1 FL=1